MPDAALNVLISSVGRRPYLVEWFKESVGSQGTVVAADADPCVAARSMADKFVVSVPAADPGYGHWLQETLVDNDISLAISINDFELSKWARLPRIDAYAPLVRLTAEVQDDVEDKLAIGERLAAYGVPAPSTWLARDLLDGRVSLDPEFEVVTKGRFGSGSRGLEYTTAGDLEDSLRHAASDVTGRDGRAAESFESALDMIVVQPQIKGQEFGLDNVCSLDGQYCGVLARRKISMRAGETDRAESVSPEQFEWLAEVLADAVPHAGLMDVDCVVDSGGEAYVIDINPRFGGGYPFSHLAGADVPSAYVAWARGADASEFLKYNYGVYGAKYISVGSVT